VLIGNPDLETPNYLLRRVRDDEMQLPENAGTSYKLVQPKPDASVAYEEIKRQPKAEEAAVSNIVPATPVPTPPAPPPAPVVEEPPKTAAPRPSFWARLFGWLSPAPAAPAEPARSPDGGERRGHRHRDRDRDRGSQGDLRRDRGRDRHGGRDRDRDRDRHRDRDRDRGERGQRGERGPRQHGGDQQQRQPRGPEQGQQGQQGQQGPQQGQGQAQAAGGGEGGGRRRSRNRRGRGGGDPQNRQRQDAQGQPRGGNGGGPAPAHEPADSLAPRPAETERAPAEFSAPPREHVPEAPREPQPAAEHVERHATQNDWSPPPAEPVYRPDPTERPAPPPSFAATGSDSAPAAPSNDDRGSS
jgi:hypothetical protein